MRRLFTLLLFALGASAFGQPLDRYPEGVAVPRSMTPLERAIWESRPRNNPPSTPPPTGPVRSVAEYEPMEGLILVYDGTAAQQLALTNIARVVTTQGGGRIYAFADTTAERESIRNSMLSNGVDLSKVEFIVATTDTIWCRDYGPRYVYQDNVRVIVDHTYNRPRPNDNLMPTVFGTYKGHSRHQIPLFHGGGNYHLDALGDGYATRLIVNENPQIDEPQIIQLWRDYQRLETRLFQPFPANVDSTQHIDMWMQVIGDDRIVISTWPLEPGSTQAQICNDAAAFFQSRNWQVFRTPAFRSGGTHYTYTNVVMFNDVVIVPTFGTGNYNGEALAVWQLAMPEKQIVQVNGQALVTSAGVFHCVVMHVPAHRGGQNPTAYVIAPNDPVQANPGQVFPIEWSSDDDVKVTSVDVLLSVDGGETFPIVLASGRDPIGPFAWTVPDLYTTQARIRVVARDADGRTGHDTSDADFTIAGVQAPTLDELTIVRGILNSGGLAQVQEEDQDYLVVDRAIPNQPGAFSRPQIEVDFGAVTTVANPGTIELDVVSRSVTGTEAKIFLRNWRTGEYDQVGIWAVAGSDVRFTVAGIAASDYVRADGRVTARVTNRQVAPAFSTYRSSFDLFRIKVRP